MAKKYVATVMNRLFLGDDNFLFIPSHTVVGEYDEPSHMFRDRNGMDHFSITDSFALQTEISTGFANLEEMDDLMEEYKCKSLTDAIAAYTGFYSRFIYYVSNTNDGEMFCVPIDYLKIRDELNQAVEDFKVQENLMKDANANKNQTPHNDDEFDFGDNPLLSEDLNANIAAFFMDLMDGVYSLEDLKEIKKRVEGQRADIDSLIDSLDLQIESSEYGESQIRLKGENAHTKRKTRPKEDSTSSSDVQTLPNYIDLMELYQKITQTLIAQNEPLKRVLIEIARKERSQLNNDRGLLITGSTGSGKTKMMELIAKYLKRPFIKIDSTQLTIPGYVGKDIEEELWRLYIQCGKDVKKAERAIVFFDEIDKKGSGRKDDVSGKGVLNVLLSFIEGATYDACESTKYQKEVVPINTRNMLVIFGGAFEDVYSQLKAKTNIGFSVDASSKGGRDATVQDFVDMAQMPKEFMGRVAIIKLNDLDLEAIKKIITESDESALKIQKKLFQELGVKLTASDDYIQAIAEQAIQRQTGARGLSNVVDESTWAAYGDAYTHLGEIDEIILGRETIDNPLQYQKVYKKRSN